MRLATELVVLNKLGLHARPAAEFVRCVQSFPGTAVTIRKAGEVYSASSILELLMANLDQGSAFTLEADGPEAEAATAQLIALVERFAQEDDESA